MYINLNISKFNLQMLAKEIQQVNRHILGFGALKDQILLSQTEVYLSEVYLQNNII